MEALINKIDWSVLEKNKVLDKIEAINLLKMVDIDPASTITKMRAIIERIVKFMFQRNFKSDAQPTNEYMSSTLFTKGFIPKTIFTYMNTIRISGNDAVHGVKESKEDVYVLMPLFTHVAEWLVSTLIDGKQDGSLDNKNEGMVKDNAVPLINREQQARIDTFLKERVELVRSARIQISNFGHYPERILLHLFPINSMTPLRLFSPDMKREMQSCSPIGFSMIDKLSSNAEGLAAYSSIKGGDRIAVGHVQMFKDGVIESVSCIKTYTDYIKERNVDFLRIESFETDCVSGLGRFLNMYSRIGILPPMLFIFTLVNFYSFKLVFYKDTRPYFEVYQKEVCQSFDTEKRIMTFPPVTITKGTERPGTILRPIFDQIWNTCGFTRSLSYDSAGNWNPVNIVQNFEKEDQDFYAFL
jgi:hypothetical protein